MTRLHLSVLMVAAVALAGCRGGAADSESREGNINPTMTVTVAKVIRAPMSRQLSLLGTTVARRHITVRAPAPGRVIGLTLQSGDVVPRGEIVARIVNRETEAAEAGLGIARQLDPSRAAELERAVKRHPAGPAIDVRAPENAVVAQRLAANGQIVADLDPLLDLVDPATVYVEASVPIDVLHLIRPGMAASVTSPVKPGVELPARVAALSPAFDSAGATAPVRLEFTGKSRIDQSGAAVVARIVTNSTSDALVVPAAALFQDAEHNSFYAFVLGSDGRAHRMAVTPGIRSPDQVQVVAGLTLGQTVITSGGYALSDGLKVRPQATSH